MAFEHTPVLLAEVIEQLRPVFSGQRAAGAKRIVDCTLGLGGYSEEFLTVFPEAEVFGLDRDRAAMESARRRLEKYGERFRAIHTNFGDMETVLREFAPVDALVFDLGVSGMQLTEGERGFSFQYAGPLDMRMDPDKTDRSAADVLKELDADELERIFRVYGEERYARRFAVKIEEARRRGNPVTTTEALVTLIRGSLPAAVQRKMGAHPARRVFQALRIYVNDELGELREGLAAGAELAGPGAVMAVVSYHSLEDRIVKHTFRTWEKEDKKGIVLTKHPIVPESGETEKNFRARSAKLRTFQFSAERRRT
ncbi:MAG: 16S rRNA (cytosine(1402)-N(4))-methyltransferase RsmH [Synergistaceae bacterium]|jgi:16S rRNA (cytosine1402-N4)-methyltransferase|nr:16S rRNA (cytosine(1402)-N(4))-methyltransferase RsmH [Synergistaceae bacterium]